MNEETTNHCAELKKLIESLFSDTNANEINDTLARMLDSYLQYSPDNRLTLANAASLKNKITSFAFNLEKLNAQRGLLISLKIENPQEKCLHS